ncbi:MAG: hypothetical protein KKD31_07695 [Bacteroidetes bacterium]|nr:hypothetical protein [Bacteroidota bacterium]
MKELLKKCDRIYRELPCCHSDGRTCNCYSCLCNEYFNTADTYECKKKLSFYVLKYAPSFSTELYHYLVKSKILDRFNNEELNILSIGCGCCHDLYCIAFYIKQRNLNINLSYTGIDKSTQWEQLYSQDAVYLQQDVVKECDLKGFDIIFINKVFSTLYENKHDKPFLDKLTEAIDRDMIFDAYLVFVDVNSKFKGRDKFNGAVAKKFNQETKYYFDGYSGGTGSNWIHLGQKNVPKGEYFRSLSVKPIMETKKNSYF